MKTSVLAAILVLMACGRAIGEDDARAASMKTSEVEPFQLSGKLHVIWGDPVGDSSVLPGHSLWLTDEKGQRWELAASEDVLRAAGGILTLNGQAVVVQGQALGVEWRKLAVDSITLRSDGTGAAVAEDIMGSQPYVWILLKFSGNSSEPATHEWFEEQALGEWGMDPYWREVSYNNVDVLGSDVWGWFQLPREPAYYGITGDTDNDTVDRGLLLDDALEVSDWAIDFNSFAGMNLIFNGPLDCCAWGGRPELTLDGTTRKWGVTWLGDGGFQGHDVITHEMGHSFGLPHSAGCGVKYESLWDVMSGGCGVCTHVDPRTGFPHGTHPNAFHKDMLGWIHPLHQYTLPNSTFGATATRLTLYDLARVPPQGELLMARAMLSTLFPRYLTVERRRWTGYDRNLPGEAVVINRVDEYLEMPADLIDVDGGDCNDEGSMWRPGEWYYESSANVLISVEWADDDSSGVTLTNAPRTGVYVNWSNAGCQDGSAACPWDTVSEGHAGVFSGGNVYISPGTYSDRIIMGKPAQLRRSGTTGSVVIGQ